MRGGETNNTDVGIVSGAASVAVDMTKEAVHIATDVTKNVLSTDVVQGALSTAADAVKPLDTPQFHEAIKTTGHLAGTVAETVIKEFPIEAAVNSASRASKALVEGAMKVGNVILMENPITGPFVAIGKLITTGAETGKVIMETGKEGVEIAGATIHGIGEAVKKVNDDIQNGVSQPATINPENVLNNNMQNGIADMKQQNSIINITKGGAKRKISQYRRERRRITRRLNKHIRQFNATRRRS